MVPRKPSGKAIFIVSYFRVRDRLQPDAEEILHAALAALEQNEHFVAMFLSDDGRCLRERMRKIAEHVADRPDGNACREMILGFYGMKDDDDLKALGEERRNGPVAVDWPIATGASKEQLHAQREILKRLRAWDEV